MTPCLKRTLSSLPLFFLLAFLPVSASAAHLVGPASVSAAPVSTSQIDLNWTDGNLKPVKATETGYSIERSLSATNGFVQIGTTSKDVTTYSDTGRTSS